MFRPLRRELAAAGVLLVAVAAALVSRPAAPAVAQSGDKLPSDLALVPGDALGFAHVRVADIWKSDPMKDLRKVLERAGPTAFATLDADFTPAPSTVDRVTTVLLPFKDKPEPRMVTILTFTKPFEAARVKKQYLPKGEELKANGKAYTADKMAGVSVHFPDDKTLVFGDADTLPQFLELSGKGKGRSPRRCGRPGRGR